MDEEESQCTLVHTGHKLCQSGVTYNQSSVFVLRTEKQKHFHRSYGTFLIRRDEGRKDHQLEHEHK